MAEKQFQNVSPNRFSELKDLLQSKGILVPEGNNGRITIPNPKILLDFVYDGENLLKLNLVDKPWLVPESLIWNKIQEGLG